MSRFVCSLLLVAAVAASAADLPDGVSVQLFLQGRDTLVTAAWVTATWPPGGSKLDSAAMAIPKSLEGCKWSDAGASETPGQLIGTCKNWPGDDEDISLAALTARLHEAGAGKVRLIVTTSNRSRSIESAPAGWVSKPADKLVHYTYDSNKADAVPGDLQLEYEYYGRGNSTTGSTVDLTVSVRANGRASLSAYMIDRDRKLDKDLLHSLPDWTGCDKTTKDSYSRYVALVCPQWVQRTSDKTGTLDLSRLVRQLHILGVDHVKLNAYGGNEDQPSTTPPPAGWRNEQTRHMLRFDSDDASQLPPVLPFTLSPPPDPKSVVLPMAIVAFVPLVIALILAVKARADKRFNWLVWFYWLQVAPLWYWIGAASPSDLMAAAGSLVRGGPGWLQLVASVVLAVAPFVIGLAGAMLIMRRLLARTEAGFRNLLRSALLPQAVLLIPISLFFLMGGDISPVELNSFLNIGICYGLYWALGQLNAKLQNRRAVTPLNSGPLYARALALAAKAGVKMSRFSIIQTHSSDEINAFASSGGKVGVTDTLLQNLTEREVDAVVAHELGHHRAGHLGMQWGNFWWFGAIIIGNLVYWAAHKYHLPLWVSHVPFGSLLALAANGFISQRHEYAADAQAAEITGDAEGKIAALGRLAQVSGYPIAPGGWLASIMTHPSTEERALALGRRYGVPAERALAIVRNPNEAYAGGLAPLARAVIQQNETPPVNMVFDDQARASYGQRLRWAIFMVPLAGSVLSGLLEWASMRLAMLQGHYSIIGMVIIGPLVLGPPIVLAALVWVERILDRKFYGRMGALLTARLNPAPGAILVDLHPGNGLRVTEGFTCVDFGFLTHENGWLCYRGEQFRFAVPVASLFNLSLVTGPIRWSRIKRVEVDYGEGAFTLSPAMATEKLFDTIHSWRLSTPAAAEPRPEPAPALPDLPGETHSRWPMTSYMFKEMGKLSLFNLAATSFWIRSFAGAGAMTTIWAPLVVAAYLVPYAIWPYRAPEPRPMRAVPKASLEPVATIEEL